MELVADYLFQRYVPKRDPLPFPKYLLPENKWKNAFWITKEGKCIHPWEMDDRHLVHTVKMINRKFTTFIQRYDDCGAYRYIEQGFYIYYHYQRIKEDLNMKNNSKPKRHAKKMGYSVPRDVQLYHALWEDYYLYMLLRREVKLRGLEEHL